MIDDTSGQYHKLLNNGKNIVIIRPDKMVVINAAKGKVDKALQKHFNVSHSIEPKKMELSYT